MIKNELESAILEICRAKSILKIDEIQQLWSGYGSILRVYLENYKYESVIVKHIKLENENNHPRGWSTNLSHARKVKSYIVEEEWYKSYNSILDENCRIPKALGFKRIANEHIFVLEDLDPAGYPKRKTSLNIKGIKLCIKWLANFHANFINHNSDGLWDSGTYWHLETRPDELEVLNDTELKKYAHVIDKKLKNAKYQTIVHGDAKLANFCFSKDMQKVAAVDFQYTGGGCGMKDLAYFVGSCLYENDCEKMEKEILDCYFIEIKRALSNIKSVNIELLEDEWRNLYKFAWTDFHRFLKGWSPGHWKINSYSERVSKEVIEILKNEDE